MSPPAAATSAASPGPAAGRPPGLRTAQRGAALDGQRDGGTSIQLLVSGCPQQSPTPAAARPLPACLASLDPERAPSVRLTVEIQAAFLGRAAEFSWDPTWFCEGWSQIYSSDGPPRGGEKNFLAGRTVQRRKGLPQEEIRSLSAKGGKWRPQPERGPALGPEAIRFVFQARWRMVLLLPTWLLGIGPGAAVTPIFWRWTLRLSGATACPLRGRGPGGGGLGRLEQPGPLVCDPGSRRPEEVVLKRSKRLWIPPPPSAWHPQTREAAAPPLTALAACVTCNHVPGLGPPGSARTW
nr:uncharacterized protein LOC123283572 [Equus asinus]